MISTYQRWADTKHMDLAYRAEVLQMMLAKTERERDAAYARTYHLEIMRLEDDGCLNG